MPTTSPALDTSGPPELPGLSEASVWITSSISRPPTERSERPSADTTPAVTVDSKPSGLPIATTTGRASAARCRPAPPTACRPEARSAAARGRCRDRRPARAPRHGYRRGTTAARDARRRHVRIGQHQPVAGDDHARAGAAARLAVLGEPFDAHDGGADAIDDRDHGARVGVEQQIVGERGGGESRGCVRSGERRRLWRIGGREMQGARRRAGRSPTCFSCPRGVSVLR